MPAASDGCVFCEFAVAQRLAGALRTCGVPCEGVNLFLADGEVAGQDVPHVPLHVLPRLPGDGFRLDVKFLSPDRADLDATAGLIRGTLGEAG
ncbi:MAG TPA: HIT family protein [Streptosporangiaceae bacterium]|jgi:diadenosine tetraphosphate (Ap4A) HIT family hydrolase|nr:HIT family protein [Streptosporangiaceae bacterium]